MAKVSRGRIAGLHGMESQTAEELHAWADRFDLRARVGGIGDDPEWLRRWANRLRCLAQQKEKAIQQKISDQRRSRKI